MRLKFYFKYMLQKNYQNTIKIGALLPLTGKNADMVFGLKKLWN